MIHSYDIFDTLLVRSCGRAELVFDLLAKRIIGTQKSDASVRMDFALERKRGEHRARVAICHDDVEEVTLSEIYDYCDFSALTDKTNKDIMEAELAVEKFCLTPVKQMQEEIEGCRQNGDPIAFISDMYLPKDFIEDRLKEFGFYKDGDHLFVSCENRKSKATGNLFTFVQQALNIDYRQWVHKGDNIHSDYNVPKRLGIKAQRVKHSYSYYEESLRRKNLSSVDMSVLQEAAISRCVRLSHDDTAYVKFAADFVAPIYVPFVYSVMEDAKRRDIKHLHFLARDGYIFYIIAQEFAEKFPDIQLHYLYVSRDSLYLPGLKEISLETLSSLFTNIDWRSLKHILSRLHMNDYPSTKIKEQGSTEDILRQLIDDHTFVAELTRKRDYQRNLCLQYFQQQGLTVGGAAIVDLTGTRRCHHAINEILHSGGYPGVFGYYFEVLEQRQVGKDYHALNYSEYYLFNNTRFTVGPHDVFEQYFSITNHNRTREYKLQQDKSVPVFETENVESAYKQTVFTNNKEICSEYARLYALQLSAANHEVCSNMALSVFTDFFYRPKKQYLKALEPLVISESAITSNKLLTKQSILSLLKNRNGRPWLYGNVIFNSLIPEFWRWLIRLNNGRKEKNER